jgi:N-acetylmuramoyl-L-alanine amidase
MLVFLLWVSFSCEPAGIRLFVGPHQEPVFPEPIVNGGTVFVPANVISPLGGSIDRISDSVLNLRVGTKSVTIEEGSDAALVNDQGVPIDGAVLSRNNVLFIPLLFIAELLDLRVSWEQGDEVLRLLQKVLPRSLSVPAPDRPAPSSMFETVPSFVPTVDPAPPEPEVLPEVLPSAGVPNTSNTWQDSNGARLKALARLEQGQTVLELTGISFDSIESCLLPVPARIVIDTTDFLPDDGADPWLLDHPWVKQVRVAPFQGKGRIVLDLHEAVGYRIEAVENGVLLRVNRGLRATEFTPSIAGGSLRLDVPAQTAYEMTKLEAPERIVIDLQDTTLLGGARHMAVSSPFVSTVRISQFDQHTVRVVLDLTAPLPELPLQTTGQDLEFVLRSEISKISLVTFDDSTVVVIEGRGSLDPQILRLRDPERVVIDIPNAWPTHTFGQVAGSGQVRELRAAQFSPQVYRVVAELTSQATVRFARFSQEAVAVVIEPASLANVRIAVDAGHGGFDPGAVGRVLGLHEADVNLDIAGRLLALLTEGEALPVMVRPDEQFVSLIDRPQIAVNHDSAMFVSIHCNSAPQNKGSGTETLYSNPDNGSLKLAMSLQAELVKALGTRDRGVKQRQLYVLSNSEIPAALVEIAFLSHPEEERKLADEGFRQKAAQAIYNGLLQFVTNHMILPHSESETLWQRIQDSPEQLSLPVVDAEEATNAGEATNAEETARVEEGGEPVQTTEDVESEGAEGVDEAYPEQSSGHSMSESDV